MNKLKPCPFCGCDDISVYTGLSGCEILCPVCGATIFRAPLKTCKTVSEVKEEVQEETISAWNRRVDDREEKATN